MPDRRGVFCLISLSMLALSGCNSHREENVTVQMCLRDDKGIRRLRDILQETAHSERMAFIDNTANFRRELALVSQTPNEKDMARWVIDYVVQMGDGMGVTAGNLGLSPHQVALGFTPGWHHRDEGFAQRLIAKLEREWKVIRTSPDQGALPLRDCA
jgi:hypothetical protein